MALDAPARVRSLTLIGTSVHCDNHTKAVSQRWAETYRDAGFDAYLLRLVKDLYYPTSSRPTPRSWASLSPAVPHRTWARCSPGPTPSERSTCGAAC